MRLFLLVFLLFSVLDCFGGIDSVLYYGRLVRRFSDMGVKGIGSCYGVRNWERMNYLGVVYGFRGGSNYGVSYRSYYGYGNLVLGYGLGCYYRSFFSSISSSSILGFADYVGNNYLGLVGFGVFRFGGFERERGFYLEYRPCVMVSGGGSGFANEIELGYDFRLEGIKRSIGLRRVGRVLGRVRDVLRGRELLACEVYLSGERVRLEGLVKDRRRLSIGLCHYGFLFGSSSLRYGSSINLSLGLLF